MNVRVMLIDSDIESIDRLVTLLQSYRIETIVATRDLDSLEYFKGNYYDMIFIDCQLVRTGISNLMFQLKKLIYSGKNDFKDQQEIPIVGLLSGSDEDWQVFLKEEMDDYLKKPIERDEIERILHSWLAGYDIAYDSDLTMSEMAGLIEHDELIQVLEELIYAIENHQYDNAESTLYQVAQRRYQNEDVMEQLHQLEEVMFIDGCSEKALVQLHQLMETLE